MCRQTTPPGTGRRAGRVVKEWVGNRCLSQVEGANRAGRKSEGDAVVCFKAEREMAAPALRDPCSGTWSLGYMGARLHGSRLKKGFHKGHKRVLFLAQDRGDWHSGRVLSGGGGSSRVSLSRGQGTLYGL